MTIKMAIRLSVIALQLHPVTEYYNVKTIPDKYQMNVRIDLIILFVLVLFPIPKGRSIQQSCVCCIFQFIQSFGLFLIGFVAFFF